MARWDAKKPKGVRWAKLRELNSRLHIGTPAWNKQPYRIKQLSAWRADHHPKIVSGHLPVRRKARSYGIKPSSDISLGTKVTFAVSRFNRKK